jgi:hypothetical protein
MEKEIVICDQKHCEQAESCDHSLPHEWDANGCPDEVEGCGGGCGWQYESKDIKHNKCINYEPSNVE